MVLINWWKLYFGKILVLGILGSEMLIRVGRNLIVLIFFCVKVIYRWFKEDLLFFGEICKVEGVGGLFDLGFLFYI